MFEGSELFNLTVESSPKKSVPRLTVHNNPSPQTKTSRDVAESDVIGKGKPDIQDLYYEIKDRVIGFDSNIEIRPTKSYIGFKVNKNFAEVHVNKQRLKIYLRPLDYDDPNDRISIIPPTHGWSLDRQVLVASEADLDDAVRFLEHSYNSVV